MKTAALLFLPLLAAAAAAGEPVGRATGPEEIVETAIWPAGDRDDLVFEGGAGWKIAASMKVLGQVTPPAPGEGEEPPVLLPLAPLLQLVGPDGEVVSTGIVPKVSAKAASLKGVLPAGGRFAFRLGGTAGTGRVQLRWKLAPARVAPVKKRVMAGDTEEEFPFQARGGALLSWTLSFAGDGAVQVVRILDPDGNDVPWDPEDTDWVLRKPTSEKVVSYPIPSDRPGGTYRLVVTNALFESSVNLAVKVALPKRAPVSSSLTLQEPTLTGISHSVGSCGVVVAVTGFHLDPDPAAVLFGGAPSPDVDVQAGASEDDADTALCELPGGAGPADVVFVASDGQVAVLSGAFAFKDPPVIASFDPTFGPGAGNVAITVTGSGFETEGSGLYELHIGGVPCSLLQVQDASTITARIPAHVSGPKQVVLVNRCGERVEAPGTFSYSTTLNISSVIPNAVPATGNVPVNVYGTGLTVAGVVWIDGAPVTSTPIQFGNAVIGHSIPASAILPHAAGKVQVRIVQGVQQAVKANGLAYFDFTDVTATAIPAATASEDWGGVSTASTDRDGNGTVDYVYVTHTGLLPGNRPGTRVLKNDGAGVFSDATALVMPVADSDHDFGGNRILSGKYNADGHPDLYLSRPGTGTEARRTGDSKWVDAWARMLFSDDAGESFVEQVHAGGSSKFSIPGTLTYTKCFVYDFDFRSVNAAAGDLDGDLDQDIVLVNDTSIADFTGVNCNYRWITCAGGYYTSCYTYSKTPIGTATRLCTVGGSGAIFDRTAELLLASPAAEDDFRAVAAAVGDLDGDAKNDIILVHDQSPGTTGGFRAARVLKQSSSGVQTTFNVAAPNFLPSIAGDDLRGHAVAIPDLNGDLKRDVVLAYDGVLPGGGPLSTRVLVYDAASQTMKDRTAAVLGGVLPAGDAGHAAFVLGQDVDRDGDADLVLATRTGAGAGNRQTRLLLNAGRDAVTGFPVLVDGSAVLPSHGADPGAARSVLAVDIDGDGDLDLIVTDERDGQATPKTRVWRQNR